MLTQLWALASLVLHPLLALAKKGHQRIDVWQVSTDVDEIHPQSTKAALSLVSALSDGFAKAFRLWTAGIELDELTGLDVLEDHQTKRW